MAIAAGQQLCVQGVPSMDKLAATCLRASCNLSQCQLGGDVLVGASGLLVDGDVRRGRPPSALSCLLEHGPLGMSQTHASVNQCLLGAVNVSVAWEAVRLLDSCASL